MMETKIIICAHKQYSFPSGDHYLPVFVGSALSCLDLPYQRDDEGDNISKKNRSYCELTGLYWAYKNLKADRVGLCHYRRYFDLNGIDVEKHDVILPKKRHYFIETVYDQFSHAHGSTGLDLARKIIEKDHNEYLQSFDRHMNERSLHLYNMFIMRYEIFIDYCDFLFDVLFKIEKELGDVDRLYGYIAERLLDVYLLKNNIRYKETRVIETEKTDWVRKIFHFLERKYRK